MVDWEKIVELHSLHVLRIASRLLNHEMDVRDCFQNTFLAAIKYAERHSVRDWSALLKRITTAEAFQCLRRRYRETAHISALDPDTIAVERNREPAIHAQANELADDLRSALLKINPVHAEIFYLACIEDVSYRELSTLFNVSVSNIGVIIHRCRADLRLILSGHSPLTPVPDQKRGDAP